MSNSRLMFIVLAVMFLFTAVCCRNEESPEHRMIREEVIEYGPADEPFKLYGYYKEVRRYYNYEYKESHFAIPYHEFPHMIHAHINEYGDTISLVYVDLTNYPRRED